MAPRRVNLSGTPGTGKTTLARALAASDPAIAVLDLSTVATDHGALLGRDRRRDSWDVDVAVLQEAVERLERQGRSSPAGAAPAVFLRVGHLAHHLRADLTVVLRADPLVLRTRLQKRGWPAAKVLENLEAELVDVITIEAVQRWGAQAVAELDTTGGDVDATVACLREVLAGKDLRHRPGKVDWSSRVGDLGPL